MFRCNYCAIVFVLFVVATETYRPVAHRARDGDQGDNSETLAGLYNVKSYAKDENPLSRIEEDIKKKSKDYFLEFQRFNEELNREDNETARFEKFQKYLSDSLKLFAPFMKVTSKKIPGEKRVKKPRKLKESNKLSQNQQDFSIKTRYRPLKDFAFETFYDYY